MLTYEEFLRTPKCRPLVLAEEDTPQDARDWRKRVEEYNREQYNAYARQHDPDLHNTEKTTLHNTPNGLRNTKWNEYMKEYRKKPVICPKCGHEFTRLRRKR